MKCSSAAWVVAITVGLCLSSIARAEEGHPDFDVNRDGRVNLEDLRIVTEFLISQELQADTFPDVNCDGEIDELDARDLTDAILLQSPTALPIEVNSEFGFTQSSITHPLAEPQVTVGVRFFRDDSFDAELDDIGSVLFDVIYDPMALTPLVMDEGQVVIDVQTDFLMAYPSTIDAFLAEPGRIRVVIHTEMRAIDFMTNNGVDENVIPFTLNFEVDDSRTPFSATTVEMSHVEAFGVEGVPLILRSQRPARRLVICFDGPTPCQDATPSQATLIVRTYDAGTGDRLPATVTLSGGFTAQRNSDGIEIFDAIPTNAYTIRAEASGYNANTVGVNLSSGVRILDVPLLRPGDTFIGEPPFDPPTIITLQTLINATLGRGSSSITVADVDQNGDGRLNAEDIQIAILLITGGRPNL